MPTKKTIDTSNLGVVAPKTLQIRTIQHYGNYNSYLINGETWLNAIAYQYAMQNAGLPGMTPCVVLNGSTIIIDQMEVVAGEQYEYKNKPIAFKSDGVKNLNFQVSAPSMSLIQYMGALGSNTQQQVFTTSVPSSPDQD